MRGLSSIIMLFMTALCLAFVSSTHAQMQRFHPPGEYDVRINTVAVHGIAATDPSDNIFVVLTNQSDQDLVATITLRSSDNKFDIEREYVVPAGTYQGYFPLTRIIYSTDWDRLNASAARIDVHLKGENRNIHLWYWMSTKSRRG